MSSLDRILPFLKSIEDLLVDPAVTEVMVNGGGRRVFVERRGCIEQVPDRTLEIRNLTVAIKNIAAFELTATFGLAATLGLKAGEPELGILQNSTLPRSHG